MTMKEAMDQRHMVRKYTDCPIPETLTVQLRERIQAYNAAQGLSIRLMTGDSRAFSPIIKLLLAKGVQNYFIMCGEDSPELEEACGYWGAELMLFAQTLGLNTWWVGGTFDRKTTSAPDRRQKGRGSDRRRLRKDSGRPPQIKVPGGCKPIPGRGTQMVSGRGGRRPFGAHRPEQAGLLSPGGSGPGLPFL